ncbi:hypothetical protein LP420_01870 [Massilia sp. B-10]|nr:hypothetical protein LP420_01870 [Massilia sp. B-10]
MNALPDSVQCRTTLASGAVATVTATRPRAGRADVKCGAAGELALAERMQQVVRLARHTEARFDSRDQVVISIDPAPARHERDWELAVVLADRMVRGVWQAPPNVHANGWSAQWQLGRIGGHDLAPDGALLGGSLGWLGSLTGQPGLRRLRIERAPGSRCTAAASTTACAGSRSASIRWPRPAARKTTASPRRAWI